MELEVFKTPDESDLRKIKETVFDSIWICRGDVSIFNELNDHVSHVKYIRFASEDRQDVSWISNLSHLKSLILHGNLKGYVDFDRLTCLEEISIDVCKATVNIFQSAVKPKELHLSKFKETLSNLSTEMYKHVFRLELSSAAMSNLDGLSRFACIKEVVLERCLKLTDISALKHHTDIKELHITGCNKIEDYSVLSLLTSLEEFSFGNKDLPSLKLLTSQKLKSIELGRSTTITDMDVKHFLTFPLLEWAIFENRKGYSMNSREISKRMPLYPG